MQLNANLTLAQLIEWNRRRAGYAPSCACGQEADVVQGTLFGGGEAYCRECYDKLGGEEE